MSDHYHIHRYWTSEKPDFERRIPDTIIVRRLLQYIIPYRRRLLLIGFSILIASLVGLSIPYLMKIAIDEYIQAKDLQNLSIVSVVCLVLYGVNWVASRLRDYNITWIGENMVNTLRHRVFAQLQILSYSYYDSAEAGDIISRVTNDTDTIGDVFVLEVINIFSNVITLAGVIIMMLFLNVKLTLASLIIVPLVALSVWSFHSAFRSAYERIQQRIAKMTSKLAENISGIREIQSFTREQETEEDFREVNLENLQANVKATQIFGAFFSISTFITQVGRLIVLVYGGYLLIHGEVTIGILVAFLAYLSRFFEPVAALTSLYNTIQSALAASERIFEIIDTRPEIRDKDDAKELLKIRGEINFQDITFAYDSQNPVLHNISFQVSPGETVAIIGPTGAGKSTIIKLLSRFYEFESGLITIDGNDIKDIKLKSLRNQIGTSWCVGSITKRCIHKKSRWFLDLH